MLEKERKFRKDHPELYEEKCEVCGRGKSDGVRVCCHCERCHDRGCNGGCIFCRTIEEEYCPTCGHKLSTGGCYK